MYYNYISTYDKIAIEKSVRKITLTRKEPARRLLSSDFAIVKCHKWEDNLLKTDRRKSS
jgi:hypothetical protein